MIEGDNIAGNKPSVIELPPSIWIFIAVLIGLLIILFIIIVYSNYKKENKINELIKFIKQDLSTKECELLIKYRKLNDNDKNVINDTINTLNKNHMKHNDTTE